MTQTGSLHVTFHRLVALAGHPLGGTEGIHTLPRSVHDDTGLNALPVEGTEATSVALSLFASVKGAKTTMHMSRILTGPDMRLEKHYALFAST